MDPEFLALITPHLPNIAAILVILIGARILLGAQNRIMQLIYKTLNVPRGYFLKVKLFVRVFIYFLTFFLILFFIPGLDEKAIALAGLALGVLVSLSSTATIGNAVAGTIIYFTRPIHEGDRVEIDGVLGDVVSLELLFVHLKTIKDSIVSIPSLKVLNGRIVNFSQLDKTIVFVRLSLGYDLDPGLIEELLLKAAKDTDDVLPDPAPFVLINSLKDYSVEYELNVYTSDPQGMVDLKTRLRRNIVLQFSCAKVQIMSPSYMGLFEIGESGKIIPEGITCKVDKQDDGSVDRGQEMVDAKKKLEEKKREDIKFKE